MRGHRGLWVPLMHLFASWVITTDLRLDCPSIRGQSSCATIVLWKGNNCSTVQAFSYTFWAIFVFSLQIFPFHCWLWSFYLLFYDLLTWSVGFLFLFRFAMFQLLFVCHLLSVLVAFQCLFCEKLWQWSACSPSLPSQSPLPIQKCTRSFFMFFFFFFWGGGGVFMHPEIAAHYFPAIVHIKPGKTLR